MPGPGTVALAGTGLVGQGPVRASGAAKAMKRAVTAAGDVKFKVRSRGNKKRTLNRTGEVKVKASGFRVSRLAGHRTGINPYLGAARD